MTFTDCPWCGRRGFHQTTRRFGFWHECTFCQMRRHSASCGIGHGDVCCCGLDDIDPRTALEAMHDGDCPAVDNSAFFGRTRRLPT